MRKILLALGTAGALTFASASNAAITVDNSSPAGLVITGPTTTGSTTTIGFTDSGLGNPTFAESITFTNDLAGLYSISLGTSSAAVNFTTAVLTGTSGSYNLTSLFDNGTLEQWGLSGLTLDAGQYVLDIGGTNSDTGVLSGTITIAAVPEPGTWAMMLLGFAGIGFSMRRRPRRLLQAA